MHLKVYKSWGHELHCKWKHFCWKLAKNWSLSSETQGWILENEMKLTVDLFPGFVAMKYLPGAVGMCYVTSWWLECAITTSKFMVAFSPKCLQCPCFVCFGGQLGRQWSRHSAESILETSFYSYFEQGWSIPIPLFMEESISSSSSTGQYQKWHWSQEQPIAFGFYSFTIPL